MKPIIWILLFVGFFSCSQKTKQNGHNTANFVSGHEFAIDSYEGEKCRCTVSSISTDEDFYIFGTKKDLLRSCEGTCSKELEANKVKLGLKTIYGTPSDRAKVLAKELNENYHPITRHCHNFKIKGEKIKKDRVVKSKEEIVSVELEEGGYVLKTDCPETWTLDSEKNRCFKSFEPSMAGFQRFYIVNDINVDIREFYKPDPYSAEFFINRERIHIGLYADKDVLRSNPFKIEKVLDLNGDFLKAKISFGTGITSYSGCTDY